MKCGVIGGGIAGLSTALALAQRQVQVLVIEQGQVGHGSSWDAAGMLAPTHELEPTELVLLHAGQASLRLYTAWEDLLGDIGLIRNGTLEVALQPVDVPYLQRLYAQQLAQGLGIEWLQGAALHELEPALAPGITAAIVAPGDWQVDNRKLVAALARACNLLGVSIIQGERATAWHQQADAITITTAQATYQVDKLVIATGSYPQEGALAPLVAITPVKGQMISLAPPPGQLLRHTIRIRSRAYGNAYIVPKADRLVLGSTQEEMGYAAELTAGGLLDILRKTYAAVPALYDLPVLETWAGLRPATSSRKPFLIKNPIAAVYYLNGLFRHGILLGPLVGQAAADLLLQDEIVNPAARELLRA